MYHEYRTSLVTISSIKISITHNPHTVGSHKLTVYYSMTYFLYSPLDYIALYSLAVRQQIATNFINLSSENYYTIC